MGSATKRIRERVTRINNAWAQGAPNATFGGITRADFNTRIEAASAADQEIADDEAQLLLKKQSRDTLYEALNDDSVKIRDGAEADPNIGRSHPLISAMGFVRADQRKTGLTRKKATKAPNA